MAQRIRSLVRVAPWIVVLLGALGPWEGRAPGPRSCLVRLGFRPRGDRPAPAPRGPEATAVPRASRALEDP